MSKFRSYVNEHLPRSVTLSELAKRAQVRPQQLSRDLRVGLEGARSERVMRYADALGCEFLDIVESGEVNEQGKG